MGVPYDENLPEVVPDSSPIAVPVGEKYYRHDQRDKYPVEHDNTPKILAQEGSPYEQEKFPVAAKYDDTPKIVAQDGSPDPINAVTPQAGPGVLGESLQSAETATNSTAGSRKGPDGASRQILGLSRKAFFLLLAVILLVVVAAGVGGGVGGAFASAKAREGSAAADQTPPTSSNSSSATSSSTSSGATSDATAGSTVSGTSSGGVTSSGSSNPTGTSSSSSSAASPTFLNNQTVSLGLAFQGFSQPQYQGSATDVLAKPGFYDLGIDCLSYVWLPSNTGCCVTFCANKTTATGWWCDPRYQPQASGPFPRIYVWCDNNDPKAKEKCS